MREELTKKKDRKRLVGKLVLITGASRGLGRQLAIDLASEGARGIALVARDAQSLEAVKREAEKRAASGSRIFAVAADLSDSREIERVVAVTMREFGGALDVLVNNASTIGPAPIPYLADLGLEEFRQVLDTNLVAPFLLTKKLLPALMKRGGSVVNVSSDVGRQGYPGWGAYGISKFGLEGMSQTWAAELSETGVRVNVVDPGDMNTDMHRAAEPEEDPARWADPSDVTEVFLYLASEESGGVSGKRFQAQSPRWRKGAVR